MKLYNYKHELLAYLDDVNPSLEKILGGISTLSFIFYKDKYDNENGLMREDERYKYVVNEAVVEYDGEFFVIKNSTPIHDEYGVIYKEVSCKHMSVELSGTKIDGLWGFSPTVESFESPYNRPTTIYNAFSDLLKNHTNGWELGIIPDSEKRRTFEFEWVTPMQVIVDLSQVYGYTPHFRTEYKYGKICKYVDLLTDDYGEIKGYYRHESTLKSIRKPITSEGITTRLYVFGYNDITLNDIPTESRTINGTSYNIHEKGKSYIDNFDYYLKQGYTYEECLKYFIKTDVVRDDLYVDPEDLYTFGKEHIEKVAMPNVSYTVVITDIDFIGKPEIEIGHKIRIYDDEMNVDLVGRVSKVSFSNDDKENKLIEISNYYTLLEEVDLLTDMVIKQNTLQTRAIKRYSKFANSIVINDSTGIIVQSDRQDLINPNSRMAEDHIPYYRDVVRIGEYEYGKYGIQILDGELQMDRYDNKTRVLINNDDGFVMYRDKDGNGEFGDNERVFWVDYDGIAHANGFTITNSDIFVGEGETIMDRFDTVTETIDGVKETTTNLSTVVNQTAEQVSLKANKTEVSELRGVVDGYEERIQQAELKVTADAIISTVSETVESAKTEAINTSSQYVDGQLVNYYTKTESDSKIEQTATEISSTVARQEVQNMEIGGTNLIGQTTQTQGYGVEVVEVTETGWNVRGSQDRDNAVFRFLNVLDRNGWYTFSFDGKFNGAGFRTYVEANDQRVGTVNLTSEWQHFSFTFEVTNYDFDSTGVYTFIEFQRLGNELYYFKNVKLEHGKIETDYSPCPRDYSTTTQMNSAIQQKADEITSIVEVTKSSGVEMIPQSYTVNSISGFKPIFGHLDVITDGLLSRTQAQIETDFIPVDRTKPIHCSYDFATVGNGQTCIFFIQYKANKDMNGDNNQAICWVDSGAGHTGRKMGEYTINAQTLLNGTRYVKLRLLVNWDNHSAFQYTYFYKLSALQLQSRSATTQIAQMSDQIALKVEADGVKSIIQQNPESVRIGFNAISNYFDLNSTRLQVGHSDGSYTQIGQNGVVYYDSYANWKYHSLMKQGWLGDISGTSWSRTIALPPSFRNKIFSVIVTVNACVAVNTHDVIKHYRITVPQATVDYANGTFVINMSALAYYVPGQGSATAITTDVSWIAIA